MTKEVSMSTISRAEQSRAEQSRAEQSRAEQSRAGKFYLFSVYTKRVGKTVGFFEWK
ncbi:hypothetical protein OfM2_18700 [Lactovum odontotermitis]